MEENMFPFYPLGDLKDGEREKPDAYLVQKLKK
jgi:2-oxoglutarate ferredoxin oxidoreductase subunit beta